MKDLGLHLAVETTSFFATVFLMIDVIDGIPWTPAQTYFFFPHGLMIVWGLGCFGYPESSSSWMRFLWIFGDKPAIGDPTFMETNLESFGKRGTPSGQTFWGYHPIVIPIPKNQSELVRYGGFLKWVVLLNHPFLFEVIPHKPAIGFFALRPPCSTNQRLGNHLETIMSFWSFPIFGGIPKTPHTTDGSGKSQKIGVMNRAPGPFLETNKLGESLC